MRRDNIVRRTSDESSATWCAGAPFQLLKLAHLVEKRNDVNRRRRRFYSIMNPPMVDKEVKYGYQLKKGEMWRNYLRTLIGKKRRCKVFTLAEAKAGYKQAKLDMRAITVHVTKVRRELKAGLRWNGGGLVTTMYIPIGEAGEDRKPYSAADIKYMADLYEAECVLFPDITE